MIQITHDATQEQTDAVSALAATLADATPQIAAGGPYLTPLMQAAALVAAAGITLRALPMASRMAGTRDREAALEAMLALTSTEGES